MEITITLKGEEALEYLKQLKNKEKQITTKKWSSDDEKMIEYCATTTTPSHRTYDYLKRKLPSNLTDDAITSKVYSLGYRVVKGIICK